MTTDNNPINKVNEMIKNSITLKLVIITTLTMILTIPSYMIREIIQERESMSKTATEEVSSKWADYQLVNGPILCIPVIYQHSEDGKTQNLTKHWYLLPDKLNINGNVDPEKLKRGIYDVVVYKSKIDVNGTFDFSSQPDPRNLLEIQYDQAFITIGISDLRGIKDEIIFLWNKQEFKVKPGIKTSSLAKSGVTVEIPDLENSISNKIDFQFSLNLRGSKNLSFVPLGNTTDIKLKSSWTAPSFNGNFLPDNRLISNDGFTASWQILQLNRNLPQSWMDIDQSANMEDSSFGVDLILPLDNYQKSMRTAKYAIMTIALTFLVFFLVEILKRGKKVHPFQYVLVGLALSIFYVLLIAISEHISFNAAYMISATSVILLITLYSFSIFKETKLSILLAVTLLGTYGFLFITLQLTDYALLMGGIGLLVILAATMYFTRKINWYKMGENNG